MQVCVPANAQVHGGDAFCARLGFHCHICRHRRGDAGSSVCVQVDSLVNRTSGLPQPGKEHLVGSLRWDTLQAVADYCAERRNRSACATVDDVTGLPSGRQFNRAVWAMLEHGYDQETGLAGTVCSPYAHSD